MAAQKIGGHSDAMARGHQQHEARVAVVLQLCAHGQAEPDGRDGNFILTKGTGYWSVEVCGIQGHGEINCFNNK